MKFRNYNVHASQNLKGDGFGKFRKVYLDFQVKRKVE